MTNFPEFRRTGKKMSHIMNKHAEYQLGMYMCDCVLSPFVYSNMHINLYICVSAYVYI